MKQSLPMLLPFLECVFGFTHLDRVFIEAPSTLSLKAGGDSHGSRRFTLKNNQIMIDELDRISGDKLLAMPIIRQVKGFVGTSHTEFELLGRNGFNATEGEIAKQEAELFDELSNSKSTLQVLVTQESWHLMLSTIGTLALWISQLQVL